MQIKFEYFLIYKALERPGNRFYAFLFIFELMPKALD